MDETVRLKDCFEDSRYVLQFENILPKTQYYSYVEITPRDHQSLWHEYEKVEELYPETFSMRQIETANDTIIFLNFMVHFFV